MTTRTWTCICGSFKGEVTGDPVLAAFDHCLMCRRYASTAMQLGVWLEPNFKVLQGDDNLIKYESSPGTFRVACKTCASFAYKALPNGAMAVPLGPLEGGPVIKPACHIWVAHKGDQAIPFPELPQYDEFPQ